MKKTVNAYLLQEYHGFKPNGNIWLMGERGKKRLSNLDYEEWRWTTVAITKELFTELSDPRHGDEGTFYMVLSDGSITAEVGQSGFKEEVMALLAKHGIATDGMTERRRVLEPDVFLTLLKAHDGLIMP